MSHLMSCVSTVILCYLAIGQTGCAESVSTSDSITLSQEAQGLPARALVQCSFNYPYVVLSITNQDTRPFTIDGELSIAVHIDCLDASDEHMKWVGSSNAERSPTTDWRGRLVSLKPGDKLRRTIDLRADRRMYGEAIGFSRDARCEVCEPSETVGRLEKPELTKKVIVRFTRSHRCLNRYIPAGLYPQRLFYAFDAIVCPRGKTVKMLTKQERSENVNM